MLLIGSASPRFAIFLICRNCGMLTKAFTCTGPYAVLIMLGIKHVENRNAMPSPPRGRCAVSCSKSFCRGEYGAFIQWASNALPPEDFDRIPSWSDIREWPGAVVGACNYDASFSNVFQLFAEPVQVRAVKAWDEGYPCWWKLSDVVCFDRPIPCRGNVGMWQMPKPLALQVSASDSLCQTIGKQVKTADDAARVFRLAVHIVSQAEGVFVLPLNARKYIIAPPILVSLGTSAATTALRANDAFLEAMQLGAEYVIVAHNHPHGTLKPSEDDVKVTSRLIDYGKAVGIPLLDHIIIDTSSCGNSFTSIKQSSLLEF